MIDLLLPLLSLALAAEPPDSSPALVQPIRGTVHVVPASRSDTRSTEPPASRPLAADAWAVAPADARLIVDQGAAARVLCADGTCRHLDATTADAASTDIDIGRWCAEHPPEPCGLLVRGSDPIDLATQERVVGDFLRRANHRLESWILRGRPRGPEERWGHHPVLVSPRCPESGRRPIGCERWLVEPRELAFLEVDGATRYGVELSGSGSLDIEPSMLACRPSSAFEGHPICRHPWPADWRLPVDGRPAHLWLRVEVGDRWRTVDKPTVLARVPGAERQRLLDELEPSSRQPADLATLQRAALYQRAGLVGELHARWHDVPDLDPTIRLVLARALVQIDLPRPARHHLRHLLSRDLGPDLTAEAELGAARTALILDDLEAACRHVERAADGFERLGRNDRDAEIASIRQDLASRH